MELSKIDMQSKFSLAVIVSLIMGAFGLFSFLAPKFTMISVNNTEIKSTNDRVEKIEEDQDKFNGYFLKISASLSEIKGHLKGLSEGRQQTIREAPRK